MKRDRYVKRKEQGNMSLREWQSDKKLIGRIVKSISAGNVSHAYIIESDNCVDKRSFAKEFLKAVTCEIDPGYGCDQCLSCRKIDHDNCEDVYFVQSDGISVKDEMITNLQENLRKKPMGKRNMAVIADADTMTVRAQNRFLKTLEEPSGETLILLLSENKDNLLETIRSRCIAYHLNGAEFFETDFQDESKSDMQKRRLGERTEPLGAADMKAASDLIDALLDKEKFFYLKEMLSKTVKNRDDAFKLLDGMERIYRNVLFQRDERSRLMRTEEVFQYVALIEEARRDLIRKVNYNYAMKNLILKIGR